MFVFDYFTERALYMELSEIIPGKKLKQPLCTLSKGEAPPQITNFEEMTSDTTSQDMDDRSMAMKVSIWMNWIRKGSKG